MSSRPKTFFYLIFTILLTLGLSLSLNYLLAAWSNPTGVPTTCPSGSPGCDAPINTAAYLQVKNGTLWIGGDNYTLNPGQFGLLVEKGNVGIGTTNPTQAKLHIGSYSSDAGGEARGLYVQTNTINVNTAAFSNASGYGVALGGIGSNTFGTVQAANFTQPSAPSRFVNLSINAQGGNVGIGTTGPNGLLSLGNSTGKAKLLVYDGGIGNNLYAGFAIDQPAGNDFTMYAHNSGVLKFGKMGTDFSTITPWMTINNSGNVGIGTTGPTFSIGRGLHISGVSGTPDAVIKLSETTSGLGNFELRSTARGTSGNRLEIGEGSDTFLTIRSDDDGGGTTSRGNVGIGTTGPGFKFTVQDGSAGWASRITNTNASNAHVYMSHGGGYGMHLRNDSANSGTYLLEVYNGSLASPDALYVRGDGNVGIGTAGPGEKLDVAGNVRAQAFYYSSDSQLKKNIFTLDNSLSKIMNLRGVRFDWRQNGRPGIGLIAQEVESVFPELVKTSDVNGLKSIEYGNLVAPLIEAMKEQQREIEELKDKIRNLEN